VLFLAIATFISLFGVNTKILVFIFLFLIFVCKLSKIPTKFFLTRILVVSPFIFLIAISYLVSKQSFLTILNVSLKSFIVILSILILVQTTRFDILIETLKEFKFPKFLLLLLSFIYRYFFVLTDEIEKMTFAVKLRQQEKFTAKTLTKLIGMLLIRSYKRAERINKAMLLRGWDGNL
jgi:cobalt/nickel transport system permease protein